MVGRSVGWSRFTSFYDFISVTSQLLPEWSSALKYGPCPPTRNIGSRVSGLVFFISSRKKQGVIKVKNKVSLWLLKHGFSFRYSRRSLWPSSLGSGPRGAYDFTWGNLFFNFSTFPPSGHALMAQILNAESRPILTRLDTCCVQFGRSNNVKTALDSNMLPTNTAR